MTPQAEFSTTHADPKDQAFSFQPYGGLCIRYTFLIHGHSRILWDHPIIQEAGQHQTGAVWIMLKLNLFDFYNQIREDNIILSLNGPISQDILVGMGEVIKTRLAEGSSRPVMRKVFSVFIELAQNILHHSAEKTTNNNGHHLGVGIIVLSETEDEFGIVSGNLMDNRLTEKVRERCEIVNRLDREGLKKFYQQELRRTKTENQKGAGIGLIDIARKSEARLHVEFKKVDDTKTFFVLSINISKKG